MSDELIRQVAINCAERGLLLLRIRDEAQMTLRAYQTLYDTSIAFGMRKAMGGEKGKSQFEIEVRSSVECRDGLVALTDASFSQLGQAEEDKRDLERQLREAKAIAESGEKKLAEQRQVEERKHMEEINFLKKTNQQLKVCAVGSDTRVTSTDFSVRFN